MGENKKGVKLTVCLSRDEDGTLCLFALASSRVGVGRLSRSDVRCDAGDF